MDPSHSLVKQPSKYNIILCELHYTPRHGKTVNSCHDIESHYIVIDRYKPYSGNTFYLEDTDDQYNNTDLDIVNTQRFYKQRYRHLVNSGMVDNIPHNTIRNFKYIVSHKSYLQAQIAECIMLPSQEMIAIIKTFWLKIIQRKWKKVFQERQTIWKKRMQPDVLMKYQMSRQWTPETAVLPSIRGLLA